MNKFTKFVKDFWQDEEGLSVVEYVVGAGLLVAALGVIFSGWGTTLQTQLNNIFTSTGS
ncbi:Flp family type IVb pilin [Vibrio fluvialis]|uniref:Flp family type IVb pilin n=1 Tax=Vibrio fluvialis TaxID=676 RepID=UPI00192B6E2C|nr:Flp family type IVb pilin [Vibrio fluvialis]MBL4237490.1 Flp family type IVb pilin [Vibrio fluvialis]MBL4264687.1 Flp family type IVb pilin [Vibrio fluvialis]MBL4269473.1 Flp family type IVb pilin [Vibrio fluvialis]MBL4273994.1 Flp family type IVb pilin [Vibrio fluvialis]MBO1440953.1 Flp family type IVb pilin [Vibrio fluvialis]